MAEFNKSKFRLLMIGTDNNQKGSLSMRMVRWSTGRTCKGLVLVATLVLSFANKRIVFLQHYQ
eukprot:10813860-Karenia_brevis.AAC.1